MLDDEDRYQPVTVQDVADALLFVILEVSRLADPSDVNAKLETMANHLMETGNSLAASKARSIVLATAQNLIETETGAFDY
jgi:hypothetical protein